MKSVEEPNSESISPETIKGFKAEKTNKSRISQTSKANNFPKGVEEERTESEKTKNKLPTKAAAPDFEVSQSSKSSTSDKSNQHKELLAITRSKELKEVNPNFTLSKEWESLTKKATGWLKLKPFFDQFEFFLDPSLLILALVTLLFFLKAYTTILSSLGRIPLAPSICQLIGTLWLTKFSINRLLLKKARQEFLFEVASRWRSFLGKEIKGL